MKKKLKIKIINLRNEKSVGLQIYLVDRRSPLGNPFRLDSEAHRTEVISQYRRWLWNVLQKRDSKAYDYFKNLAQILMQSQQIVLGCWCVPKPCHAQVIANALVWYVNENYSNYEVEVN